MGSKLTIANRAVGDGEGNTNINNNHARLSLFNHLYFLCRKYMHIYVCVYGCVYVCIILTTPFMRITAWFIGR